MIPRNIISIKRNISINNLDDLIYNIIKDNDNLQNLILIGKVNIKTNIVSLNSDKNKINLQDLKFVLSKYRYKHILESSKNYDLNINVYICPKDTKIEKKDINEIKIINWKYLILLIIILLSLYLYFFI